MLNFDVWCVNRAELQDYRAAKNVFFKSHVAGIEMWFLVLSKCVTSGKLVSLCSVYL